MSDFLDKYAERGLLSYLDVTDDIEAVLPGPSEKERNESRLRKIITGEKRPASHTTKEAGAWVGANIALPLLAGVLKGASTVSKTKNGVRIINKFAKPGQDIPEAMRAAEKATERYAKKTAERAAKKKAETKGSSLFSKLLTSGLADKNPVEVTARAAKQDAKDVKKAIKILNKYHVPQQAGDIINKEAMKSGKIATATTAGGVRAGSVVSNGGVDTGDYNKLKKDVKDYDNRIEMGKGRKAWQFIKGLVDLDDLNPDIYPMEQVNDVLNDLIENTNAWSHVQIDRLGDDEKIKLIKDIAKGKYDTDENTLSYELYKSYKNLTNKEEENK